MSARQRGDGQAGESYRSVIVEQFCPHVGRKVLGFRTYRLERGEEPENGGQAPLYQEVIRSVCLHRETCQHLGCVTGLDPFAP